LPLDSELDRAVARGGGDFRGGVGGGVRDHGGGGRKWPRRPEDAHGSFECHASCAPFLKYARVKRLIRQALGLP
jgi:hypothetical protein